MTRTNSFRAVRKVCDDMLPYRYDADLRQWRQFDGYCWYALTPLH